MIIKIVSVRIKVLLGTNDLIWFDLMWSLLLLILFLSRERIELFPLDKIIIPTDSMVIEYINWTFNRQDQLALITSGRGNNVSGQRHIVAVSIFRYFIPLCLWKLATTRIVTSSTISVYLFFFSLSIHKFHLFNFLKNFFPRENRERSELNQIV